MKASLFDMTLNDYQEELHAKQWRKISVSALMDAIREPFFDACKLFHDVFHISFNDYLDINLTVIFNKPIIDIYKFDDWLHSVYGQYEDQNLSMGAILKKNYGDDVTAKIINLAGIGD
jgi:hypothetical protein